MTYQQRRCFNRAMRIVFNDVARNNELLDLEQLFNEVKVAEEADVNTDELDAAVADVLSKTSDEIKASIQR